MNEQLQSSLQWWPLSMHLQLARSLCDTKWQSWVQRMNYFEFILIYWERQTIISTWDRPFSCSRRRRIYHQRQSCPLLPETGRRESPRWKMHRHHLVDLRNWLILSLQVTTVLWRVFYIAYWRPFHYSCNLCEYPTVKLVDTRLPSIMSNRSSPDSRHDNQRYS